MPPSSSEEVGVYLLSCSGTTVGFRVVMFSLHNDIGLSDLVLFKDFIFPFSMLDCDVKISADYGIPL